jgi:hypothetical protein
VPNIRPYLWSSAVSIVPLQIAEGLVSHPRDDIGWAIRLLADAGARQRIAAAR